jgi:aryl-alcohol dehydrogenase-like predicted oxidoreductase
MLARALAPYEVGEDVYVFTKCGRSWYGRPPGVIENDLRPESIRYECEQSLRRLGLDRIDLYQIHWPDWTTGTLLEESWGTMAELVAEGKARWIGVCNFDRDQLDRCEAIRHVDSLQPPLSLLERGTRDTVISWAQEHSTGVIPYRPMAGGMLTGAVDARRMEQLAEDDWRRQSPMFAEPELSRNLGLVDRLRPIAARMGVSLPTLVVAWVLAQPGVTGAIVGARRPSQIDDWIPALDLMLDESTLNEIDAAVAESGAGTDEPPTPPARMLAQAAKASKE